MERQTDITVINLQVSDLSTWFKSKVLYSHMEQICDTREKYRKAKSYIEAFPLH